MYGFDPYSNTSFGMDSLGFGIGPLSPVPPTTVSSIPSVDVTDVNTKKLSLLISDQLPAFIRDDHETFVSLMEAYYEFMELEGGAIAVGRNLIEAQDVDKTFPLFLDHFYSNFIPLIPKTALGDRTLFLKHAKHFYRAKGTEKSFKLLFRLLFDENVDIRYPKKNILIASGGNWATEQSLRVIPDDVSDFGDPTGFKIIGETSNASATIDKVKISTFFGDTIYELFITNVIGNFISSERFIAQTTLADAASSPPSQEVLMNR